MTVTIISNVRLFDGTNVHDKARVTFDSDSGTILEVNTSPDASSVDPSANSKATTIDGAGHTLLPGLIEAHVHVYDLHLPPGADHSQVLHTPLKCGVTTICDMHSDPDTILNFRRDIEEDVEAARKGKGTVSLCDLKSSLYGATIEGGWPKPIVLAHEPSDELKAKVSKWPSLTPSNASDFIASHKSTGADYIKLMQENCCSLALPTNSIPVASLETQTAVVNAAHKANLLVVGHATSRESTEIVLNSGADGLTHTFIDQSPTEDIIELYKKNNAFVIPTLVVLSSLTNELQGLREKYAKIASEHLGVIDDFTKQTMVEFLGMKAPQCAIEHGFETIRMFRKHGVDVVAGTDSAAGLKGTGIGPSLWMELELYVERCGMSVIEALRSATGVSADRFRFDDRGKVEVGRRADLVLVKGDPTERLDDFWDKEKGIQGVWKLGWKAI
ncbi:hypothetical protein LTR05_002687 [Lithohypha guttulata]|uniref:Amidohydrolase-related domain-containing protein n=1 Tax=Lithohypha guttulata TaxID=1690604 RepID=A0AAN7YJ76_9EURO|nr:hypothetical protein LTR05_002687 [Lithohypha guttulata]